MKIISPKDFLDSISKGLNCFIFSFDEDGVIYKSTGDHLNEFEPIYYQLENTIKKPLNNFHITLENGELKFNDYLIKWQKIFIPILNESKKMGLLWIFISKDNDIQVENILPMIQNLSYTYSLLLNFNSIQEKNNLYRQAAYSISNMATNGILLYDKDENLLFYNNSAENMNIVHKDYKKILDTNTEEFYSGNKLIGKMRYTLNKKSLPEQDNNIISNFNKIIGKSTQIDKVLFTINQVASTDTTVLLRGDSGTGKEEYAKLIYKLSPRRNEPFVTLNCGAIPENLLESELFGYEGGAFTGAKKEGKIGKFQLANNGTIFLDEIGDMSSNLQVKLLRVLQERYIEPVGSNKKIPINVRIICATHQNLEDRIKSGDFREDLFYRINVIPINIPSLNSRKDDIEILLTYYIKKYCILQKKDFMTFSYDTMKFLKNYNWPGNVRELINVVEYCVTMTNKSIIELNNLPNYIKLKQSPSQITKKHSKSSKPTKEELLILLDEFGHDTESKKRLASHLNISLATLYRWLSKT